MSTFTPAGYTANPAFGGNVQQIDPEITAEQMAALEGAVVINRDNIVAPAGTVYYVDGNVGDDTLDGLSWDNAMKTLAVAFATSNLVTAAAAGIAKRNRIYYRGALAEGSTEVLVTLPNKCDVIGVGSFGTNTMPMLIGTHVIGAGDYDAVRFINFGFESVAAGGVIFTVPGTTAGLEFIGCKFNGDSTTEATIGLLATAVLNLKVINCEFIGKISTAAISLGAGAADGLLIAGCVIESGAIGILVDASFTCAAKMAKILANWFAVVTLIVDENSDKVMITDNKGVTESDGTLVLTLDYNAALSVNNMIACTSGTASTYPILTATLPT